MQEVKNAAADVKNTFFSGGPGTTGREVFEDSTASGPGANYSSSGGATGGAGGVGSGLGAGSGATGAGAGVGSGTGSGVGSAGVAGYGSTGAATSGTGASGLGSGNTPSGQYGSVSSVGQGGALGGDGTHHLQHPVHHNAGHGEHRAAEGAAAGVAAGAAGEAAAHHHHHHGHHGHHHGNSQGAGLTGAGAGTGASAVGATGTTGATQQESARGPIGADQPAVNAGAGSVGTSNAPTDRTGNLGQDSHLYERTGNQGPLTSGAAGTDRFDTDKPSSGAASSGVTGAGTGHGEGQYRVPEGEAGSEPKKSGGIMGILGTSDKDFTNRDRKGEGAYADTEGHFKMNTSGPNTNTALTGREGTVENNPVAQAKSAGGGTATGAGTATGGDVAGRTSTDARSIGSDGQPKKKGFMDKVKEALA